MVIEAVLVVAHLDVVRQVTDVHKDCQEIQCPVEYSGRPEAVRVDHKARYGGPEEASEVERPRPEPGHEQVRRQIPLVAEPDRGGLRATEGGDHDEGEADADETHETLNEGHRGLQVDEGQGADQSEDDCQEEVPGQGNRRYVRHALADL